MDIFEVAWQVFNIKLEALEREAAREQGPACLSPREAPQLSVVDLERSHPITLTETGTDFLLVMPCVTIAGDSEEAKVVEAANKRYTQLLAQRAATD
ncbi:WD_REPEATS_REGION domain-containing protein, partial [Haematococcus lacustris]